MMYVQDGVREMPSIWLQLVDPFPFQPHLPVEVQEDTAVKSLRIRAFAKYYECKCKYLMVCGVMQITSALQQRLTSQQIKERATERCKVFKWLNKKRTKKNEAL